MKIANRRNLFLAGALGGFLAFPWQAWCVPQGFNVQGRLTDANGINRDGAFSIKFTILDAFTGGASVWSRTFPSVPVRNGNFQVVLEDPDDTGRKLMDAMNAPSPSLEIQVLSGPGISGPEPPLVPRQRLVSVPFALKAQTVEQGIPTGAILLFIGSTCPFGFSEVVELRNRFPIGTDLSGSNAFVPDAPGQLGGTDTHAHGLANHTHSGATNFGTRIFCCGDGSTPPNASGNRAHIHGFTTGGPSPNLSDPTVVYPPFVTVLFCRKT